MLKDSTHRVAGQVLKELTCCLGKVTRKMTLTTYFIIDIREGERERYIYIYIYIYREREREREN
jgi:hypothetical protein